MATVSQVITQPASGLDHIDALLGSGPGWNWLAPTRNVVYYSFSTTPGNPSAGGQISGNVSAFNAAQQSATLAALDYIGDLTGIMFTAADSGSAADLHFGTADILGTGVAGLCSWNYSYGSSGNTVISYTADAWIYLDSVQWAGQSADPAPGSEGYQTLLHELGHALGLKHPFEGSVTLPASRDSSEYTLMSYTRVGNPDEGFAPYDVAALMWLYGGDGLGGQLGQGTSGLYLVGSEAADTLIGGAGNDSFEGEAGNDIILGGAGTDSVHYSGNRALYTISSNGSVTTISGPKGSDTLTSVERAVFADLTVTLGAGNANNAPTGGIAISGNPRQGSPLSASSTVADDDGLGTLSWRWQSSSDGSNWSDIGGATALTFTPTEAQVGLKLRVLAGYTDGLGKAESAASASTSGVANVNDAPTGALGLTGTPQQGTTLRASSSLADADGLGTIRYEWQSSSDGSQWSAIAGATGTGFTPGLDQVGLQIRAWARWTDGHGSSEAVASPASASVLGRQTGGGGADSLNGTAYVDRLEGGNGNDRLRGGGGNDQLYGDAGLDTAMYQRARADYTIADRASTVQARAGDEGRDALDQVERLVFSDQSLAFDLDGAAGHTARILGAVFGRESVANPAFVGIGLSQLDQGSSLDALMQLALEARLGVGFSAAAEVQLLFQNVVGSNPSASELDFWTGALEAGTYTPVSLAWMAANLELNALNIDLVGLTDVGLPYFG